MLLFYLGLSNASATPHALIEPTARGTREWMVSGGYVFAVGQHTPRRRGLGAELAKRVTPRWSVLAYGDLAPIGRPQDLRSRTLLQRRWLSWTEESRIPVGTVTQVRAHGGAGLRWVPVRGAMSVADELIVGVDLGLMAGLAVVDSHSYPIERDPDYNLHIGTPAGGQHLGPFIGIGQRLRVSRRLGATWFVRGVVFQPHGLDPDRERALHPFVTGGLQLTWWLRS